MRRSSRGDLLYFSAPETGDFPIRFLNRAGDPDERKRLASCRIVGSPCSLHPMTNDSLHQLHLAFKRGNNEASSQPIGSCTACKVMNIKVRNGRGYDLFSLVINRIMHQSEVKVRPRLHCDGSPPKAPHLFW